MSLENLAGILSISIKQVQKYETGADQLFPVRMQQIASALDVPIGYFFETSAALEASISELMSQPDAVRLAVAYSRIKNVALRKGVSALVESISTYNSLSLLANPGDPPSRDSDRPPFEAVSLP